MLNRARLAGLVIAALVVAGCGTSGSGDGVIDELETDHPLLADLTLETAQRIERETAASVTSFSTPTGVFQRFVPRSGGSLLGVAEEAVGVAESLGWRVTANDTRTRWCGSMPRRDEADGVVNLEIAILTDSATGPDRVFVDLITAARACVPPG